MTESRFISEKSASWRELESILKSGSFRRGRLDFQTVSRLDTLYRAASSDLAYAQTYFGNSDISAYLNHLVAKAHNRFYSEKRRSLRGVLDFFTVALPKTLRETLPFSALAFFVFLAGALYAFLFTYFAPETAGAFLGDMANSLNYEQSGSVNWDMPVMSSIIMTNNIRVSILAMTLGITFGVGTAYVLFSNGLMLGSLSALMVVNGNPLVYWSLILPHGVLELAAIFLSGGAGFLIAKAMLRPGRLRRGDALRRSGERALKLMGAVCPMLVIAGLIEGFLTGSPLPAPAKLVFAAATGVLLLFYFLLGRNRERAAA
ncbi:stage II sporulation protein M [Oscillospiraceae bacterium OttesenSCG-928-G22]|nr:stage II sporulation protein M [Oscillospiraceae bacterium OttesenSCG-928-G22]